MVNNHVHIRIREDTKQKLDEAIALFRSENPGYERVRLSYDFIVDRIVTRWKEL